MEIAHVDADRLLEHVFANLASARGGFLLTANLDILRRHARDDVARELYDSADVRVADGMPLVWASAIAGDALPERIAGASLVPRLLERAAEEGRSVYLLGGDSGVADEARALLAVRHPALRIVGTSSPFVACPPTPEEVAPILDGIVACRPDIVLVAMGSPKQEYLCRAIRAALPSVWTIGVGASLSFLVGRVSRAPLVLQRLGLEWAHRLSQEPGRLAHRYLVDDLPFGLALAASAMATRFRRVRVVATRD